MGVPVVRSSTPRWPWRPPIGEPVTFAPGPRLRAALEATQPLHDAFAAAGHRLFLVGGIVRDDLAGRSRSSPDYDLTTDARPDAIKAIIAPFADAVWAQGEKFGTIGATISGHDYEITTHRADEYDPSSRKPVVAFGDDVHDDLARRDFTVNAMAVDCADGSLVDPFGGADDLAAGVLRTPLAPDVSFSDDPLRMLRAARFIATFGFVPVPELVGAVEGMADRMDIVSVERVRDELTKMLVLADPAPGFVFLRETGLLRHVLPRLAAAARDPEAVAGRVARVAPEAAARWSALLLDLPRADRLGELARLKPSGELTAAVAWLGSADRWFDATHPSDHPSLRRAAAATPAHGSLEEFLGFVEAVRDPTRSGADVDAARAELAVLRAAEPDLDSPELPIDGLAVAAILGIEPGPAVGEAITRLREHRFEHGPFDAATAAAILESASSD